MSDKDIATLFIVLVIAISAISIATIPAWIAWYKGRSLLGWTILSVLLALSGIGWVVLFFIAIGIAPDRDVVAERRKRRLDREADRAARRRLRR